MTGQRRATNTRNSHACDRCRARKRKCTSSPSTPTEQCDECYAFDVQCTFLHPGLGKGIRRKRRPNRRHGPEQINIQDASPRGPLDGSQTFQPVPSQTVAQASPCPSTTQFSPGSAVVVVSTPVHDVVTVGAAVTDPALALLSLNPISSPQVCCSISPRSVDNSNGSSSWPHNVLQEYQGTVAQILPFMDTDAPLSELGVCSLQALLQSPLWDGQHGRRQSTGEVYPHGIMRRMALRYMRDVPVSILSENETRAALLLYLQTPIKEEDEESADLTYLFERVANHIKPQPLADSTPSDHSPATADRRRSSTSPISLPACVTLVCLWKRLEMPQTFSPATLSRPDPEPHSNPLTKAFIHLSRILYSMIWDDDRPISSVEIDLLLWPATLSTELSFVNRSLASPSSTLLHVLHSAIAMRYYASRIDSKAALLEPNEAVLSFLATLGCSCIKVWSQRRAEMMQVWGNIFVIAIGTAVTMLCRFVQQYRCSKCEGVLVNFILSLEPSETALFRQELIDEAVRTLSIPKDVPLRDQQVMLRRNTCGPEFDIPDSEGTIIYWMFRDLRNMTLRGMEHLNRRQSASNYSASFTSSPVTHRT